MMPLTDEQWRLIEPLLPEPSPFARGRPPFNPRLVMEGVLCRMRHAVPWYYLPEFYSGETPSDGHPQFPSWQTCYRAYRLWQRRGLMDQIYRLLFQDLRDRGGTDIFQLFKDGALSLDGNPFGKPENFDREYPHTWQGSTIQLLYNVIILRQKKLVP